MAKPPRNGNKKHEEAPHEEVPMQGIPPQEPATGTNVAIGNEMPPTSMPPTAMDEGHAALTMLEEMGETSEGRGVSRSAEDIIIPSIMVLQGLSPQVDPGNPAFIEGARVGAIWMRNYSTPIIDGKEGFLFQSCAFYKDWFEWIPRESGGGGGGGFAGVHAEVEEVYDGTRLVGLRVPNGTIAKEVPDPRAPSGRKMQWCMPNGNLLSETRHHVGFVISRQGAVPFVINLASTGHTVSKNFMFTLTNKMVNGRPLDSWAMIYRFTTYQRKNKKGAWYEFEVRDATVNDIVPGTFFVDDHGRVILPSGEVVRKMVNGVVTDAIVRRPSGLYADPVSANRGKMLYEAVAAGKRRMDTGIAGSDEDAAPVRDGQGGSEHGDPGPSYQDEESPF